MLSIVAPLLKKIARAQRKRVNVPVIGIGSITIGGCGKTTLAISLAEHLTNQGEKVGILLRGYPGSKQYTSMGIPYNAPTSLMYSVGDEAIFLSRINPNIRIYTGQDRPSSARLAIQDGCSILIVDDAFQQGGLFCDVEIVCISSGEGLGNRLLLPIGPLREPPINLKYSTKVAITKTNIFPPTKRLLSTLAPLKPIYLPLQATAPEPSKLQSKRCILVSAIRDKKSFLRLASKTGAMVVNHLSAPDHHIFTVKELLLTERMAKGSKADIILTTAKDLPKLENIDFPVLALEVRYPVKGVLH